MEYCLQAWLEFYQHRCYQISMDLNDISKLPDQPLAEDAVDTSRRRAKTRERICKAALDCFLKHGVEKTSVEQITSAAGVSRATFYLHFRSKEQALLGLLNDQSPSLTALFAGLRDMDRVTFEGVREWVVGYVRILRQHRRHLQLFSLAMVYDHGPRALVMTQRRELMDLLGQRYPAFNCNANDHQGQAAALLMMFQIEQTVSTLAHDDQLVDEDAFLDVVARRLSAFLQGHL